MGALQGLTIHFTHIYIKTFTLNKLIQFGALLTNHLTPNLLIMKRKYLIAVVLLFTLKGFSQGTPNYGAEMKFNLNNDSSKHLKALFRAQMWGQNNPNPF